MDGRKEHISSCFFHSKQQFIGVCPFCLNDKLLLLATKQGRGGSHGIIHAFPLKKLPINKLPKIFALGSLLKHWKSENSAHLDVSTSCSSQEDSFISIKFEEDGVASWENGEVNPKVSIEHCSPNKEAKVTNKSVIEHAQPRASLRWRKRIDHLFQVIKGKRSSKANVCHMGSKVNGINLMGKGWMRTLTKRTKE